MSIDSFLIDIKSRSGKDANQKVFNIQRGLLTVNRSTRSILNFSVAMCVLMSAIVAWASITGSISGVVSDPSGAVLPGVTVVATSASTGVQSRTVTDASGFYSFPTLSVGSYSVSVRHLGFSNFVETGVKLDVNSELRVDIKLEVGAVENAVTVQANQLQVETQSTQMGEVIESSRITSVPLNGRSFIDLLSLQPGVSPYQNPDTTGTVLVSGDLNPGTQSVNGGRVGSNGFMVNGADAEEDYHNGTALIPNLDSIAQFRIITNNFDAEYGNYSGGQVNVVTKSGTNQYHGDVFEFLRNTDLDAANYYSPQQRGVYIQNQFGGTLGGPIRKDRVFWFGDFQATKQIIGQTQNYPVPSNADRIGNLSDQPGFGSGTVNGAYFAGILSRRLGYAVTPGEPYSGCTSTAACVFPNGVIPQRAWSPVAANTLKYIPSANVDPTSATATYQTSSYPQTLSDYKGGIRMDANTRYGLLFGYYYSDQYNLVSPYISGNIPGFDGTSSGHSQMGNIGLTSTLNSSSVNDFRFVYLRNVNLQGLPQGGLGVSLSSLGFNTPWNSTGGIGNIAPQIAGVPTMTFNNYQFGVPLSSARDYNNIFQLIDNFTKVVGTHTLQFGGEGHYDQLNERNYNSENGSFNFTGSETGLDFADFLIGAPTQFTQGSEGILDGRSKYYGFYAQDSWRARSNLTINYGMRWEVSAPWHDTQNKIETFIPGEQSQVFPGAPAGLVVPGDPGVPRTLAPTKYNNFAPRFGLAYSPNAKSGLLSKIVGGPGNSSIRAGYGLFYSALQQAVNFAEIGDAPYGLYYQSLTPPLLESPFVTRSTGQSMGIDFPVAWPSANVSASNPDTSFNWSSVAPITGSTFFYPHNVLPYVQEYELSVQRGLGAATVLSLNYVGTVGKQMPTWEDSNPGIPSLCLQLSNPASLAPGSQPCGPFGEQSSYTLASGKVVNSTRMYGSQFGSNPYVRTTASSSYNSLQVSLKHTDKYVNFMIGYTYSKSMDNGSSAFDATNPFNPGLSRALSAFDVPQDLVVSYTVKLPLNKIVGNNRMIDQVAGGWSLSGITTFASGQPIQLTESDDRSLSGTFSDPIDEPSYADNGSHLFVNRNPRSQQPYFNPNYFVPEPLGQVGNVMRRFFTGPGINNSDMALVKDTAIAETKQLQFRAEAFNVFNHAQFNNPSGNVDNTGGGGFGYVTSARNPRIMQVALKLMF